MSAEKGSETIRLQFELDRADNPRLYDELIKFKQGSKRVNRLRTMAHEGLMAQYVQLGGTIIAQNVREDDTRTVEGGSALTNQIFDDPIVE
jgi:hypothetical protein